MLCPNCKTRNPIGFKLCHECGAPMAAPVGELAVEEALQAETERRHQHAAALLAGALELRAQRQYPEAIPLAEEASEIMPDSASAFTLLASLYERTGDHERAILAMERVVAINPESVEDKVRLERMKDGIILPEEPRRNPIWSQLLPVGAAAGVAATIFAIGYPI
ncbi:MAG: tetratricopeptide repeat protein, partial [bacterium]